MILESFMVLIVGDLCCYNCEMASYDLFCDSCEISSCYLCCASFCSVVTLVKIDVKWPFVT